MPSATDAALFRAANAELAARAEREFTSFYASLDLARPERVRDELLAFTPTLTTRYGVATASVAADFYDAMRATEGIAGRFLATPAAPFAVAAVRERVRYAARNLFMDTPHLTRDLLDGAVRKYALQPGRDTIINAAKADPRAEGWHREVRPGACKFCRALAANGGVYRSERSATFAAHDDCQCVAVPSWDAGAPQVPVEAYRASQRYERVRRRAARGDERAQAVLERHRVATREWVATFDQ